MRFDEALSTWLVDPSRENTATLRTAIQGAPNYVTSPAFEPAATAVQTGDYPRAFDALMGLMPAVFLSPLAHSLLARTLLGLGQEDDASREKAFARASLVTILDSGDGSLARPWIVLRITDEYDVLASLGEKSSMQVPLEDGGRLIDAITTRTGNTYHFELWRRGERVKGSAA